MKKLLSIIAIVAAIIAATTAACDNKPPFAELQQAVDSVNAYYGAQPEMTAPGATLEYDQITNTVKIRYELPSPQVAEFYKENIGISEDFLVGSTLPEAPYGLFAKIVDADASVMIVYDWEPDGHSEYLIDSDRLKAAYKTMQQPPGDSPQ